MLDHDVKDKLHSAFVDLVDKFLESHIGALRVSVFRHIAVVDLGEVHRMVTMIVKTRTVLYNGSDPYCSETEGLDVIQLVDKSLEVSAPLGVVDVFHAIPTIGVVGRIAVIETRCHGEIDCLVTEVRAVANERSRLC